MVNNVVLAWAAPVSPAILGAQIAAYTQTKDRMSIFRWCVEHAVSGTPLGQLPVEVADMIAGCLLRVTIAERLAVWDQNLKCFHGVCRPSQHITRGEYHQLLTNYMSYAKRGTEGRYIQGSLTQFDEERFEKFLQVQDIGAKDHAEKVQRFEETIDYNDTEFDRAREVGPTKNSCQSHSVILN